MPYIYKYTDELDGVVKYIGIIRKDTNFPKRFDQHYYHDSWCKNNEWKIEYAYYDSITDVEMLEGHFISYYQTDEWFNKAKANWGMSSFNIDIKWETYNMWRTKPWTVCRYDDLLNKYHDEVRDLSIKIKEMSEEIHKLTQVRDEDIKESQIKWIDKRLYLIPYNVGYKTSIEDAYMDYMCFCEENDLYCVEDKYEWFDILSSRWRLKGNIRNTNDKKFIVDVVLISSDDYPTIKKWVVQKQKEAISSFNAMKVK